MTVGMAQVAELNARMDRLPVWGLSKLLFLVMGIAWFFIFYDLTSIGFTLPSIVQEYHLTEAQIGYPVTSNLIAYMVGSYILGSWSDYVGRRKAMITSVSIMAIGALLTAFSWNLATLTIFRFITGLGMGALIALSSTIMTELSPAKHRGKNVALNLIWGGVGLAGTSFIALPLVPIPGIGWRIVFAIGALIAVLFFFLREDIVPESPRWMVLNGYGDNAIRLVESMESKARIVYGRELPPVDSAHGEAGLTKFPTLELLKPPYLARLMMVFCFWFFWYLWTYGYLSFGPTLLSKMGISVPNSLLYSAINNLAFPIGVLVSLAVIDRMQRKYLIGISCCAVLLGFVLMGVSHSLPLTFIGGFLIGMGNLGGVGQAYVYTAEIFPTRARASALSIGDGLGHLGGAVQPFIIVPAMIAFGARDTFLFMAIAALINFILIIAFGRRTTGESLTELAN